MSKKHFHFLVIDDDEDLLNLYKVLLEDAGHKVTALTSGQNALEEVIAHQPDCVISDLVLPTIGGFDLFSSIRKVEKIKQPTFIIITSRHYSHDMKYAEEIGIDGYMPKPINPETFVKAVLEIISPKMIVQFWGVRGTLPVPGKRSARYGGNTNCITLMIGKKQLFIFDAGTGIKALSNFLMQEKTQLKGKIFLSHPHWDHINGLPYFVPFYIKNNEFEIFGANHPGVNLEKMVSAQMDSIYFPVTVKEFSALISYHPLEEETINFDDISVQTMYLVHPGRCLGYRIQYKMKSFCYITDNEIYLEKSQFFNKYDFDRLVAFVGNADFLIIDTTYTDEEYATKVNWGHSCVSRVVDLVHKAKVKVLCLHHHDPEQSDDDIDKKLKTAKDLLKSLGSKTRCIAAKEGESITI
jgi:phosphoribosyl 1,2-cyclic phosphodiesterase